VLTRVAVAAALVVLVAAIAWWLRRRQVPAPPTQPRWQAPAQIDRADFPAAGEPWLVVLFTSATCHTCADMARKAAVLASRHVAVAEVEFTARRDLHRKYGIDAVPILLVAGPDGAVRATFIGPATATDLWAAVAEARDPGTTPEPGLGRG
jgi:Thioredoxin